MKKDWYGGCLNELGGLRRIPWRMRRCFHNPPYIQVETMDKILRKRVCITVLNLECI